MPQKIVFLGKYNTGMKTGGNSSDTFLSTVLIVIYSRCYMNKKQTFSYFAKVLAKTRLLSVVKALQLCKNRKSEVYKNYTNLHNLFLQINMNFHIGIFYFS